MKKSTALVLICLLMFCIFLSGCSERIERNREISKQAKRYAESMAVEYISDKYGFKAEPLGYEILGNDVFMAWESTPVVAVPMVHEDKQFCVILNMNSNSSRYDNWQGDEVAKVLESYILEQLDMPDSVYSDLNFFTWYGYGEQYITVDGKSYDSDNMLGFYYDGQSAEYLIKEISDIDYLGNFAQFDFSMEDVVFDETVFPVRQNTDHQIDISLDFHLLSGDDPSGKNLTRRHDLIYDMDWRGMREYLSFRFTYDKDGTPLLKRNFCTFLSTEIRGTSFVGMSPFDPAVCIRASDEQLVWRYESHKYDQNSIVSTTIYEFEQLGPLFYAVIPEEMLAEAAQMEDISPYFCGSIPQTYLDKFEDELCIGYYWPDTHLQKIESMPHDTHDTAEVFRVVDELRPNVDTAFSPVKFAILRLTSKNTIEVDSQK